MHHDLHKKTNHMSHKHHGTSILVIAILSNSFWASLVYLCCVNNVKLDILMIYSRDLLCKVCNSIYEIMRCYVILCVVLLVHFHCNAITVHNNNHSCHPSHTHEHITLRSESWRNAWKENQRQNFVHSKWLHLRCKMKTDECFGCDRYLLLSCLLTYTHARTHTHTHT